MKRIVLVLVLALLSGVAWAQDYSMTMAPDSATFLAPEGVEGSGSADVAILLSSTVEGVEVQGWSFGVMVDGRRPNDGIPRRIVPAVLPKPRLVDGQ